MKRYVHNIVIYDDKTDWFGDIGTQICECEKVMKSGNTIISNSIKDAEIFGYVYLNLESPYEDDEPDFESKYILCYSEYDFNETYNRCCDAILHHPKAIDLRGLKVKMVDE